MTQSGTKTLATEVRFQMTERLARIKAEGAERAYRPRQQVKTANLTHAYFHLYGDLPLRERQARSLAYALSQEPVVIYPHERVNGVFYDYSQPFLYGAKDSPWFDINAARVGELRVLQELPETEAFFGKADGSDAFLISRGGFPGHVAWNYNLILELGVEGLMARHRQARDASHDAKAREYYDCVLICLEAMMESNRRHVAELRRMLGDAKSAAERTFIAENLAVMEQVPAKPARNFREAIQSFYFQWLCVMFESPWGGNSPGRLDYVMWPYLKAEYDSGNLSYQDAAELIAELFLRMDEPVHRADGHVNTIVVGGVKPDGTDAVNPLSFIMLDVFERLQITHPAVYTRISKVNPKAYVRRAVEYMLKGGNRAQILSDDAIIAAMTRDDRMPFTDAAMYICGGCMEINPQGLNSDLLFSFLYNVPKTLELLITGGQCLVNHRARLNVGRNLTDFADFDSFYAAFEQEVRRVLHLKFRALDIHSEEMARCRPTFLLSSMVDDCLSRGREQQDGGARYSDYGGTPLGIQNAADSLLALKRAVFEERFCTAADMVAALTADFEGHEALRQRLLALPKYGMGNAEADAMMNRVLATVCTVFDEYRNRHGGRVKPIIFTFVWAPEMGRALGASPDGRKAGEPIAHGLTPQGMAMNRGLTTAISSYTTIDSRQVSGGASTMWDLDPDWATPELLQAIVQTFIAQGGQIFQGNMSTSVEELKKAKANPSAYPNLIVRVGGFSARFVNLGREVQDEIINRYRHRQ